MVLFTCLAKVWAFFVFVSPISSCEGCILSLSASCSVYLLSFICRIRECNQWAFCHPGNQVRITSRIPSGLPLLLRTPRGPHPCVSRRFCFLFSQSRRCQRSSNDLLPCSLPRLLFPGCRSWCGLCWGLWVPSGLLGTNPVWSWPRR